MTDLRNDITPPAGSSHTVRWDGADLATLEEAARTLAFRNQIRVTKTDIIRRGALREAREILEEAAA